MCRLSACIGGGLAPLSKGAALRRSSAALRRSSGCKAAEGVPEQRVAWADDARVGC